MKKHRSWKWLFHAFALLGLIWAGVKYIDGDAMWMALHRFYWPYAPLILGLSLLYVFVKGWRFVGLVREFKGVKRTTILRAYVAGQAHAMMPGGVAVRAALLEDVGVPMAQGGAAVALSGISDQLVLLMCAMISAWWFEPARKPVEIMLAVLGVVSILLGIEASRNWLLKFIEYWLGKFKLVGQWHKFLKSLQHIASPAILISSLFNAAFAFSLMLLALHLSIRGIGAEVTFGTLLMAFTLPSLLGRISALPGGAGVTEAGMIGVLDAASGVTLNEAAAAVTIFRIGTTLFAALVGALVYFFGWRGKMGKQQKDISIPEMNKAS